MCLVENIKHVITLRDGFGKDMFISISLEKTSRSIVPCYANIICYRIFLDFIENTNQLNFNQ